MKREIQRNTTVLMLVAASLQYDQLTESRYGDCLRQHSADLPALSDPETHYRQGRHC